jgi:hypothetical protein
MKKLLVLLAFAVGTFLLCGAAAPAPSTGPYLGSSKSNVYHRGSCRSVKQIKADNLVSFPTKEEAQKKGYRACLVCKP